MRKNILFFGIILGVPIVIKLLLDAFGGASWETSLLRAALVPAADAFLNTFNSPAVGLILSFLIFLAAFAFAASFLFGKSSRIAGALSAARAAVDEPPRPGEAAYDHLSRAFSSTPMLERMLVQAAGDRGRRFDRNAASVFEQRLRLSEFDRSGLSLGLYRQLPDFFVAAGLILTFCGLVAGLYFASRGLMTADIALARDSLNKLLSASTLKFMTSIAGVGGALMMSVAYRIGLDSMERERRELLASIEDLLARPEHPAA